VAERWIVLELSSKADGEDPDLVRRSIRHAVRDADVFIPAAVTTVGEDKVVRYLVEGYAFIRKTRPDADYSRLVGTRYVNALLKHGRELATIALSEIERMRSQVRAESEQGIEVGDTVMIMSGPYRQITAVVHEDIPEHDSVQVFIRLRSKEALVTLPRNFLRLVAKAQRAPLESRATGLIDWMQGFWPIVVWSGRGLTVIQAKRGRWQKIRAYREALEETGSRLIAVDRLVKTALPEFPGNLRSNQVEYTRVSAWIRRRDWSDGLRATSQFVLDLAPARKQHRHFQRVLAYDQRFQPLAGYFNAHRLPLDLGSLPKFESRYMEVMWASDVLQRIRSIGEEVTVIEQEMQSSEDVDMESQPRSVAAITGDVDHIVVDALNLAVRCFYAPGLCELKDSQGRLTGVFYGVLNTLSAFRRKYPAATIYVAWDGSSRRRKNLFSGYKASRGTMPVEDWQIEWLRGILPLLGVGQAWNPEEEADDVIATLVRGPLKGKRNVVFSTDRDMLQLVDASTVWLTPAVGKAKETAYDPKAVEDKWGVLPENIVLLRSMLGDTSDEIPGIGIFKNVATNLVKAYGSVDRICASRLAGLTKLQYDKVRAGESVIRRNMELMTLRVDLALTQVPAKSDRIAAGTRLKDADVKPDSILAAFFGEQSAGSVK
jgi:5'-3' exonuclease/transcription antitermination factor NusG